MKTLRELHKEVAVIYGEAEVKKLLRDFYKNLISSKSVCEEVINYLNEKTKSRFSAKSKVTKSAVFGRIREGYTLEDFRKVIDAMSLRWMGTEMQPYLRPVTLFSASKFGGYLSEWERDEAKRKAKEEAILQKNIEEKAKLGEAVRKGLRPWYSFKSYQELWSYVGQLNEREFKNYQMPSIYRDIQSKWLLIKLKGQTDKMKQIELKYSFDAKKERDKNENRR